MNISEISEKLSDEIEKATDLKPVFGESQQIGNRTIIPVAVVSVRAKGEKPAKKVGRNPKGKKTLSAYKELNVESRPIGYIEIIDQEAKFVQINDPTKLALRRIMNGLVAIILFGTAAIINAAGGIQRKKSKKKEEEMKNILEKTKKMPLIAIIAIPLIIIGWIGGIVAWILRLKRKAKD